MIKKNSVSRKKLVKYSNKHQRLTKTKHTIKQPYIKLHNLSKFKIPLIYLYDKSNLIISNG